jgi:hypothetical protein
MWKFSQYVRDDQSVPIEDWYSTLAPEERAEFDIAIDVFERTDDWDSYKRIHEKYLELERELKGLTELKFDMTTRQGGKNYTKRFRPVGFMNKGEKTFILLGGFQKGRRNKPIPENAFERILKDKKAFENGRGSIRDHKT